MTKTRLLVLLFFLGVCFTTISPAQAQTQTPAVPTVTTLPTVATTPQPTVLSTATLVPSPPLDGNILIPAFLGFLTATAGTCIWPLALVMTIFLLRKHIPTIFRNLRVLKLKDFQMEFGERLGDLTDVAEKGNLPESETTPETDHKSPDKEGQLSIKDREEHLLSLAKVHPRGAILEAWLMVESELRKVARDNNIEASPKTTPFSKLIWSLKRAVLISDEALQVANGLSHLRNQAVHEIDIPITYENAVEFIALTIRVLNYFSRYAD